MNADYQDEIKCLKSEQHGEEICSNEQPGDEEEKSKTWEKQKSKE